MWMLRTGGWEDGQWQRGFGAYAKYFHATAERLAECATKSMVEQIANNAYGDGIDEKDRAAFEAERVDILRAQQEMLLAAMGVGECHGFGRGEGGEEVVVVLVGSLPCFFGETLWCSCW